MQRLYCYVDESGQDTRGRLFLVSVVITERSLREELERRLLEIEQQSGKKATKWQKTSFDRRMAYLNGVLQLSRLSGSLFYAVYSESREYVSLSAWTVAQAIGIKAIGDYQATILIDGLNDRERQQVRRELQRLRVRYRDVRGVRDEASPFIRLADALAGFLRDHEEGKQYTQGLGSVSFVGEMFQMTKGPPLVYKEAIHRASSPR
jgi:hypothetical protein